MTPRWARPQPDRADAPILLLFHGLEGSLASPYARHLLHAAASLGWRALLMHFRGCVASPNRLPRTYHSGNTADAYWLIGQLARASRRRVSQQLADWQSTMSAIHFALDSERCKKKQVINPGWQTLAAPFPRLLLRHGHRRSFEAASPSVGSRCHKR